MSGDEIRIAKTQLSGDTSPEIVVDYSGTLQQIENCIFRDGVAFPKWLHPAKIQEFEIKSKLNKSEKISKGGRHISNEVRTEVWNRDEGKCAQCKANQDLQFDHIVPFSKGGSNSTLNIQLLCGNCNRKKSDRV